MLKKQSTVLFHNRGKTEQGEIVRKWRRKETVYFNIKTERGVILENVTTDQSMPCHVLEQLSIKLNEKLK